MPQAPSPATPTVLCRGVTKRYELGARSVDALRGIDLAIEGAGFYAIMGASGSGKSTLMHLVAGLDRPTAGEVSVAGVRVDRMSEAELTMYRRRQVGIVFQHFNLLPSMTALENVMLPALLDGMSRAASETRARQLMDELGVEERAEHRPDALSGGEQQRVAVARALANKPALVLADEPTGNLDEATADKVFREFVKLVREEGSAALVATHNERLAYAMDRVVRLHEGRLE